MRKVGERLYVALSILALVVAVVGAAVAARPSSADFVAISTSPSNSLTTLLPLAPSHDPVATRAAGVVRLTWTASATAATHTVTYTVLRRPAGSGAYAQVAGPLSALTYDDTPPADGSYEYVVRANVATFSSDDSTARSGLSDRTAPVASLTCNGAACSATSWYNAAISVVLSATDGGSGVATVTRAVDGAAAATTSAPASFSVSGDSATHSVAYSATDVAGNVSGTTTQTLKIDGTAPTISGAATPAANGAGWRTTDVTITYTCSDALSGVASCSAPVTLSTDGANQSSSGTAVDVAGNSAGATVSGINLDKTAPSTPVLTLTQGALLGGATVEASWTASTDATSGLSGYTIRWVQTGTCPAASVANYPSSASVAAGHTTHSIPGTLLATYCAYVLATDAAGNSVNGAPQGPVTAR